MQYKDIFTNSIISLGLLTSLCIVTAPTAKANTASGWGSAPAAEYLGRAQGCAANQSKRDFQLSEYTSSVIISNAQGLQVKTQVSSRTTGAIVRESEWLNNVTISPTICYDPLTESPRVIVRAGAGAAYQNYNGGSWMAPTLDYARKEIGTYQRGYAHLQPVGRTPTITLSYPLNQFVNTARPQFLVSTAEISPLYGATQLYRSYFSFWRNDTRLSLDLILQGGVAGTHSFIPRAFTDGLYTVKVTQQLNGVFGVQNRAPSDNECGVGKQKLDVALVERNSLTPANLRGLSPRLVVMNKTTGAAVQTINFNSGNSITPTFCIDTTVNSIGFQMSLSPSAQYFNGSSDVLTGYTQVVVANNRNYTRVIFDLPRRTQQITSDFTLTAQEINMNLGALQDSYQKRWSGEPVGNWTVPSDFYVDTTAPTASVTLTGSSTPVESRVNAVVNVRDLGSGMRSFNLVLIPTRTPQNMASVTVPFTVGAGLIGGPKDQQTARLSLRVLPGTDYQYYVVATDVAGNRYQTPRQTLRTDNVYADLDASNFRITSTCLPADVGGDMSAVCPLTRADVRMNNVGGREITPSTQVPYRIESQPATGGSWSTVTTGNYSGGLQPGALSNAIPLSLTNLRGGSRLRLVVNLAPQLNNAIGEQNFTNNTSAPLTLTFRQEPPKLLLEVDRTVVRVNETVSIRYEIESPNPVSCELKDGGNTRTITHTTGTTQATVTSTPIANSRTITLSCTTPDGTVTDTSVNVSVVPNVQEV
jgi:hypothetical protein